MTDDLGREAMTMIKRVGCAHQCSMPHEQSDLILRQFKTVARIECGIMNTKADWIRWMADLNRLITPLISS